MSKKCCKSERDITSALLKVGLVGWYSGPHNGTVLTASFLHDYMASSKRLVTCT